MVYLRHTGEGAAIFGGSPGKEKIRMAVPKANQRAVNKYKKNNYDRIEITVPKGQRAVFQAHAATLGESVNGFICRAVTETMERDGGGDTIVNHDGSSRAAGPRAVQREAGTAPAGRVVYRVPAADTAGTPQEATETSTGAGVVSLPLDTLEAAERAAKRTGETVPDFVARAVAEQQKRDDKSFKLRINPA